MCTGIMQPAKAPPKAPSNTGARNMGFPTAPSSRISRSQPQTSRGGQRGQSGSRNSVPESVSNPQGFDFSRMSDQEFQTARNLPGLYLNYLTDEAQVRRAEAIQKEVDRRDAPRRLAEERRAFIAQQQAEMQVLQRQYEERAAVARQQAEAAQSQHETQLADMARQGSAERQRVLDASNAERSRIQAEAKQKVERIGAASGAVSSSLRALAIRGNQPQGPTAQTAGRKRQAAGARATTASLRMGATGSGSGAGANLSV